MVRGSNVARWMRAVLAGLLVVAGLAAPAGARVATRANAARVAAPLSAPPQAYAVVDDATGCVLAGEAEHQALPPASTSKIMTALTAVERLAPDALITVSNLAAQQPASRIGMQAGQQWPFKDALATLMMVSANDAAYAIAEGSSGSLEKFAAAETATAKRLGLKDSTFADPAGLDDATSFGGGPRMSAYDIAIATRNALHVPDIAQWAKAVNWEFDDPTGAPRTLVNHNEMLPGASRGYTGATGFKTGYTNRAGHTFVATATRDGRTVIAVVMNTYDTYGWATQLLDTAFANPAPTPKCETKVPDVKARTYTDRQLDLQGFLALARGGSALDAALGPTIPTTTSTLAGGVVATTTTTTTAPRAPSGGAAAAAADDDGDQRAAGGGGGDWFTLRNVVLVLLVLATAFVFLRRRAVRRQRQRRINRRRETAAAMRRGGLPVVDGRYRSGTRMGPPVESHVRLHRNRDD